MDGLNWKVERQTQQSLSQSSTRVLQSQNIRVSTNFSQIKFPLIMEENQWSPEGSESSTDLDLLKKKMMERMPFDMSMTNNFPNLLNGSATSAGMMSKEGFSMTREIKAMKMEQAQVQFSSSRSSSLQQQHQGIQKQQVVQMPCMPSSNSWVTNMNMNLHGEQSSRKEMTSSSTISSSSSCASATATSAMGLGITRSFSSSSGFPPTSMSSGSINSDGIDSALSNSHALVHHHSDFPSFGSNSSSPFKRPFGFRNFDRPLWTDISFNGKDNHGNRMTWDPATRLSMKSSSSQFQISASQHTFFEATNGSFRAFKDQRLFLRQSYGASESESENEDDDLDFNPKSITYRQKSALPYIPKLAITDKPHYAPSETDDTSSIAPSDIDTSPRTSIIDTSCPSTPEHRKCFKVAQELLTTERTYVKILHLIDQVFHFRVDQDNRVQNMFPPETITQMFCNIKSLYRLHNDHLLPKLEERLATWEETPRIGDIMKNFAPFLKMYSEYVQNFDNSINLINVYREKNARFRNIIDEIQKMEDCGNLPIQHHLIGPIQRIPRYRLLLEAYLRRLPEESPDRPETEKALEIVSKAAEHANDAMRRIVGFKKLLEVQEKVKGVMDLVSPTRLLLKEGKISKISARTGDHQERYMFLFSDVILLCSMRPMANRMISSAPYQLRAKLDVASITVAEGDDLEVVNTFYVEDNNKKIELYTQTPTEKSDWMTAIHSAREELLERKSSLRLGSASPTEEELGLKEPAKLKSDSVSKCMECYMGFTMLKRKHHCHACGIIICAKCSDAKLPLQYAGGKSCRVCKRCKEILSEKHASTNKTNSSSEASTPDDLVEKLRGVLDVPGNAPAVLNGHLNLRLRGKKEWTTRWFALRSDFVLYCYGKEIDERSMTATPIPGMSVLMTEELPKSDMPNLASNEKDRTFRIAHGHGHKTYFFLAANREEALKWVQSLKLAAKAELVSCASGNGANSSNANNQQ